MDENKIVVKDGDNVIIYNVLFISKCNINFGIIPVSI